MKRNLGIIILIYTIVLYPASQITITESGTYQIGTNITYNSTSSADSIIAINASNVVVDLNNKVLTQGNPGVSMLAGIAIASNTSNVKIKNGTINNITGSGVLVQSGDQGIILDTIMTNSCTNGFSIQNANLVSINNCASLFATTGNAFLINGGLFALLDGIFTYSTRSDAIVLQDTSNASVKNAIVTLGSGNGISVTTKSDLINLDKIVTISCQTNGINLSQSTNCTLSNIAILNCATSGSTAFNISQSSFLNILGCKLLQNGTSSSNLTAVSISSCNQSSFRDMVMSSSTNSLTGMSITQGNQLLFSDCNVISSYAVNGITGCTINDILTTSCVFDNCSLVNCVSPNGITGFVSSGNSLVFRNCAVSNNACGPNFTAFNCTGHMYIFDNCNIKNNTCNTATSFVFFLNTVNKFLVNKCSMVNNILTIAGGQGLVCFFLASSTLGSFKDTIVGNNSSQGPYAAYDLGSTSSVHLTNCQAVNSLGATGATGILVSTASSTNCIRCISNNHYATAGSATGFSFSSSTNVAAQDCKAFRNNGSGGSTGFTISGNVSPTFIRNTASGHPNNNFVGFNANNFDVPTDSVFDTNFSCTPWTNFGVNG